MAEKRNGFVDTSKLPDPSGHVEHDQYYRPLKDRGQVGRDSRIAKKEKSVETPGEELKDKNVFETVQEVLQQIKTLEINHLQRNRVHDLNNVAQILRGRLEILEGNFDGTFDGTFVELEARDDLRSSYSQILGALSNFYKK